MKTDLENINKKGKQKLQVFVHSKKTVKIIAKKSPSFFFNFRTSKSRGVTEENKYIIFTFC